MASFKPFFLLLALGTCLFFTEAKPRLTRELGSLYDDILTREFKDLLDEKLFGQRMAPSDVWAMKLRRFARHFDLDGNGVVTKDEIVGKTVEEAKNSLDTETAAEVADTVAEAWKALFGMPENGLTISSDDIVKTADMVCGNEDRKRELRIWARNVFEEADTNHNAELSRSEHRLSFEMLRVPPAGLEASFVAADRNNNGSVEKVELVDAVVDYFCNKSQDSPLFGQ
ncbi:uncharacterized protein LOC106179210 [Lingula anatina]|uniref:Uncharacterized protein LOC106179210 n=1 Tax=Lingula anatina TaxID=7574 RepID=A0A1S3K6D8_LINAN|nr:uncharacterized protein LOC106179210 [Lingula anatina]|eukprot:XP_013418195.1 uncharacterized protein LOC106179210 [Lingula anatina]